jgi:RimJ/RimL family protein N-acetyltransferase
MGFVPPTPAVIRSGVEIIIRSALPEDAEPQVTFAREMFRTSPMVLRLPEEFTMTVDEERAFLRQHLDAPTSLFLLATHGGAIIGCASVDGQPRRKIAHQAVIGMGIGETWRGRGVGDALMHTIVTWGEATPGLEILTLGVYAANENAVRLYRKHGFVEYGRLRRALKHPSGEEFENIDMYRRVKP